MSVTMCSYVRNMSIKLVECVCSIAANNRNEFHKPKAYSRTTYEKDSKIRWRNALDVICFWFNHCLCVFITWTKCPWNMSTSAYVYCDYVDIRKNNNIDDLNLVLVMQLYSVYFFLVAFHFERAYGFHILLMPFSVGFRFLLVFFFLDRKCLSCSCVHIFFGHIFTSIT